MDRRLAISLPLVHLDVWSEPEGGTEVELGIPASIAYARSPARRRFRLFAKRTGTNS